jgi:hypothetical protein
MRRIAGACAIPRDEQPDGGSDEAERDAGQNAITCPEDTIHDPLPPVAPEVEQIIGNFF